MNHTAISKIANLMSRENQPNEERNEESCKEGREESCP